MHSQKRKNGDIDMGGEQFPEKSGPFEESIADVEGISGPMTTTDHQLKIQLP